MLDRIYYVICADGCKFESMTKEQILAAIAEATGATVTDIDAAFISKIKNQKDGGIIKLWRGTSAEYNALSEHDAECYYIITDDTTAETVNKTLKEIDKNITALEETVDKQAGTMSKLDEALKAFTKVEGTLTATAGKNGEEVGTLKYIKNGNAIQVYGNVRLDVDNDLCFPTIYLTDNNGGFIQPTDADQEFPVTLNKRYAETPENTIAADMVFYNASTSIRFDIEGFHPTDATASYNAEINIMYLI